MTEKAKKIREMLLAGTIYREIAKEIGVSFSAISYHASSLGLKRFTRPTYRWDDIQKEIDAGLTALAIQKKYGISRQTFCVAINKGAISYKSVAKMSASEYGATIKGRAQVWHRRTLTRKLKREGREEKCAICDLDLWNGKKIPLEIDHIDGDSRNNCPSNLRFLCLNCHSQTPTYRARNRNRYKLP